MAGYKAHMAFGMVTAAGWTFIVITLSLVSVWFLPLIFIAATYFGTGILVFLITAFTAGLVYKKDPRIV